jgi:hypothetical protein
LRNGTILFFRLLTSEVFVALRSLSHSGNRKILPRNKHFTKNVFVVVFLMSPLLRISST